MSINTWLAGAIFSLSLVGCALDDGALSEDPDDTDDTTVMAMESGDTDMAVEDTPEEYSDMVPADLTEGPDAIGGNHKNGDEGIYPAAVFRGCYYGSTALYDCQIYGTYGVYNGWWSWFNCDNRYCSSGGIGLVTER